MADWLIIIRNIGSTVTPAETIATIDGHSAKAKRDGVLHRGTHVARGCKLADIDPYATCLTRLPHHFR